ncbi:hypothetical protein EYF80_056882 [Liparis tanakae]|uniref:Uncharacterized protein n=1 Tax=Liparis tanakae TaxID=230148 RepID=A0A4Z2EVP2_9TELE|nr:hypothetical protein EYF80_056882 [Liparis tanakae]
MVSVPVVKRRKVRAERQNGQVQAGRPNCGCLLTACDRKQVHLPGLVLSPDTMPTADPRTAWAQVMGEEMNSETMKIPPVHGLSQP